MISNLLVMVIVGGYETFVSRLRLQGHPDEPEWLSHVNAGVLKVKLAMAIIGISSIHLLRTFIEAGGLGIEGSRATEQGVLWQTVIHCVFILSAIGIAFVDRMSQGPVVERVHHKARTVLKQDTRIRTANLRIVTSLDNSQDKMMGVRCRAVFPPCKTP